MRWLVLLLLLLLLASSPALCAEDTAQRKHSPPPVVDFTLNGGFNYAGLDAGAVIMASNKESKGTNNLLNPDPDKYSLSPTAASSAWWFVIGLSEEILVTSFVVSNQEKYSSSVKRFSLHASHTFYPDGSANTWSLVGEFERPHHRGTDTFVVNGPKWARYLKFQVLSTHGTEMYCTLTGIKVYGQTTIETLREDMAQSQQQQHQQQQQQQQKRPPSAQGECHVHKDLESIFHISWPSSATESPFTAVAFSPVESPAASSSSPNPPSSMDNIFKTLMEKVKLVEGELLTLRQENARLKQLVERTVLSEQAKHHTLAREALQRMERHVERVSMRLVAHEHMALAALVWLVAYYAVLRRLCRC